MSTITSTESGTGTSKIRLALALPCSAFAFFLLFLLGEGVAIPDTVPGADYIKMGILVGGMAGYFVLAQFLLSIGHPQAVRKDWPLILALNLSLILLGVAILREGPVLKALGWLAVVVSTVACSYAGAALAARVARRRQQRTGAVERPTLP